MKYSVITKDSFIVLCLHLTPNYPSGGGLLIMIGWTFPYCLLPYSEKKNETQVSVQWKLTTLVYAWEFPLELDERSVVIKPNGLVEYVVNNHTVWNHLREVFTCVDSQIHLFYSISIVSTCRIVYYAKV